jgi:phospholipid-transporting ATPase
MIFALIPGVSPISPLTSIIPVIFIFGTTYIKDGLEDIVRKTFSQKASLFVRQICKL